MKTEQLPEYLIPVDKPSSMASIILLPAHFTYAKRRWPEESQKMQEYRVRQLIWFICKSRSTTSTAERLHWWCKAQAVLSEGRDDDRIENLSESELDEELRKAIEIMIRKSQPQRQKVALITHVDPSIADAIKLKSKKIGLSVSAYIRSQLIEVDHGETE